MTVCAEGGHVQRLAGADSRALQANARRTMGCTLWLISFSASRSSSPASTTTDVVPSPTSASCTLEISINTLAAGLSTCMDCRIVAPSFVTVTLSLPWRWPKQLGKGRLWRPAGRCDAATHHGLQDLVHALGPQRRLHQV